MQTTAIVTANQGDMSEVLVMRSEACGSCAAAGACHTKPSTHTIPNTLGLVPGDGVVVEMREKTFFRNVFLLYIMPVLFFVGGIALATLWQSRTGTVDETKSFLAGLAALVVFAFVIRFVNQKLEGTEDWTMVRRVSLQELAEAPCPSAEEKSA
ncbi:MAG: SoxR reducing system RseC family protein [Peptoniphilaceae bacterium]|nr:SoxR reducing system RseC family protein [Peptoniphilaceae bacterium]MDY6086007.1 SoxR reducing system RseC family protein [Peptoniphilaceae bacterium]